MSNYGDQRGGDHGDQLGYGSDHREQRDYVGDRRRYNRGPRRGPVTCYNCDEVGHYASQCPHPRRNTRYGPSSSMDLRRARSSSPRRQEQGSYRYAPTQDHLQTKVAEIGKSIAAVCQYVQNEQQKKAAKERKRAEKKEAAELKVTRDRAQEEEEEGEEQKGGRDDRGDEQEAGHEDRCAGSPPMELPPKRTPRKTGPVNLTTRFTRTKFKAAKKTPTPRKTPASIRKKKLPASIGVVGRLKFEKQVMQELKSLDVLVLQNVCKEEGIPYNGKFEVIFDIAAQRTPMAYGTDEECEELPQGGEKVPAVEVTDAEVTV
ncbi:hypothetical protein CBR_g114 [Chara braunii]|uniref:CCHC-type domain-containing protein n=1 Tax=Chara braunii TaxID=69332 RepID=A0A388JLT8_CHABU|nr:hypothetical protein CBR_g114 [Chara braunii]|eukprot:GBG58713.1 hypothetical protein CBR_g114 [Chara braunii]